MKRKPSRQNQRNGSATQPGKYFEEITSFIGSELAESDGSRAGRMPRSATRILTISWSWSPRHSRRSEYRISPDRKRKTWNLYEVSWDHENDKQTCRRVATGTPSSDISIERASVMLLRATWIAEMQAFDFSPKGGRIEGEGIITERVVARIISDLDWMMQSSWLCLQSAENFETLRMQLPDIPDEQSLIALEEIESCIKDLALPANLSELCIRLEVSPPRLLALACVLVRDATVVRERKEIVYSRNVSDYREQIDVLVSQLNDSSSSGGGMRKPSMRDATRSYLERYVGDNGALPTGKKIISSVFNMAIDFDELRKRHSL
jgi:hypothetical protein